VTFFRAGTKAPAFDSSTKWPECKKRTITVSQCAAVRNARLVHLIAKICRTSLRSVANTKTVPTKISDLRIALEEPLPPPRELHADLPVGEAEAAHIVLSRSVVRDILLDKDNRLLVVVGPCSIHEPESALEYAARLRDVSARVNGALFLVMRVYFEKPRTRMGWKGLI